MSLMKTVLASLWPLVAICSAAQGYSILAFFPFLIPSHHNVYQPIVNGLLDRGHKVTYFSPISLRDAPQENSNYTEILFTNYMEEVKKIMIEKMGQTEDPNPQEMWFPQLLMIMFAKLFGLEIGKVTLRDEKFRALIESSNKYDCILYSGTFMQDIYSGLSHRFSAPLIEVLPAGNFHYAYWLHGNPYDSSYIVDFSVSSSDRMSFLERIRNTFNSLLLRSFWYLYFGPKYQKLMDEEFRYPGWKNRPTMEDLMSRHTGMVLVNTHISLNYPYPMSPNFKEIGGINIVKPKPLPKDLQEFMDSAQEGVIYFTTGSHINASVLFQGDLRRSIIKAFSKVKQKVLMKWDFEISDLPNNIKISKWFPQQDILNHKNCKLFITHGGFLSLTEAIYYGVPLIGIPIMGDQLKNINHMRVYEYGIHLDFHNLTEKSILWAVDRLLSDPKYRDNIQKRAQLFQDKPETAVETAVYWTEYVIRHKGAHHLRPAIATMPWYQQAMLDVYTAIALIVLLPIYIMYKLLKCIVNCILCRSSKKPKVQNKNKKNQ